MTDHIELTGVEPLFEDQVNERYEFSVRVQNDEFKGIYHEGKVHWFQPHPNLEEIQLEAVEAMVINLMKDQDGKKFENFEVKPLFEGQVNERHQFTLNINRNSFQGVYHDGKIHWFNPQPDRHLESVENKVHDAMNNPLQ